MSPLLFTISYASAGDLKAHLVEHARQGAALLPLTAGPEAQQYASLRLAIEVEGQRCELRASVLQAMPGVGLAVQIEDTRPAEQLVARVEPAEPPSPPEVRVSGGEPVVEGAVTERGDDVRRKADPIARRGMGPLSWPVERLQTEFSSLSVADRVRLAKYGKRHARALVLRSQDKMLHNFLLANSGISPEEVANLAGMASIAPALLQRLVGSPEWLRHSSVVRALICNPKITTSQVVKLIRLLRVEELRRLAKTGKVRAGIKREIIRFIERGR